jgi:tripartite-type tricarboxylate transporter receptor subunit TctC
MPHFSRRHFMRFSAASAATAAAGTLPGAHAQAYPARPINLICPWPAGGPTDAVMRAMADAAGRALNGTMILENRAGAGGTLGANALAQGKPDGYLLSQIAMGVFRLPHLQKMQFDPLKDITYIACLTGYTFGLVVPASSPVKNIKELVAFAKANPGKFTYGSTGIGTTPHLVMEEFSAKAGINMTHVPFKGNADGMQALIGGHVMGHSDSTGWAGQVDAGRVRLLATYGSRRTKRWPNVPTLREEGYDTVSDSPFGIGGPAGMDAALVRRLQDAFKATLEDPKVVQLLEQYDQPVIYMDSPTYTRFARETFAAEKATIERLGLNKGT